MGFCGTDNSHGIISEMIAQGLMQAARARFRQTASGDVNHWFPSEISEHLAPDIT
jgi:hypothetical protein